MNGKSINKRNFYDFKVENASLNKIWKAIPRLEMIDKCDYIKIKNLYLS